MKLFTVSIILLLFISIVYAEIDEDLGIIIFPKINSFLRMHVEGNANIITTDSIVMKSYYIIFGVALAHMNIAIWEVDKDIISIVGQSINGNGLSVGFVINFYSRGNVYILYGSGHKSKLAW